MRNRRTFLGAAVLLWAAPLAAQSTGFNFSGYYSLGASLAAGFESGALVRQHQAVSVPALVAHQAAVADFQMPLVSDPGIPTELALLALSPAPIIAPKSDRIGAPLNLTLPRPYNHVAAPGATLHDSITRVSDNGGLHDLILRGRGSQLQQIVSQHPSVVTVWIGNNDVLGAAVRGRAIEGVTLTPAAAFRSQYQTLIDSLRTTGARIVAANLPDVTNIPF